MRKAFHALALLLSTLSAGSALAKPDAAAGLQLLMDGNGRFATGALTHPNSDKFREVLAAKSDQGQYAYATIVSCSDSRVPIEYIFDAGIMDLFVIRIAGNVCNTDEIGSIEYGTCHVKTPILVILGHSQCGAVTAVTKGLKGEGHPLEKNIPPLVNGIVPAVQRAIDAAPDAPMAQVITRAIEENVYQGIENVFLKSAAVRAMAKSGNLQVVGGVYDLETGRVRWLPAPKTMEILKAVEANPKCEQEAMAGGGHEAPHKDPHASH